jgi:deoxyribose-phosphate aldolase
MAQITDQKLVELITEEVRKVLGNGHNLNQNSGPGRGTPVVAPSSAAHNGGHPTPTTPCSSGKNDCISCGWSVSRRPDDARTLKKLGAERFSAKAKIGALVPEDLAGSIDHTLLKAEATREELEELCTEAAKHHFASVCVNPINVRYCKARLQSTSTMVITVVGFPLGATTTAAKVCETRKAVEDGADEIDMVINIGLLKSGCYNEVEEDIRRTVKAAHPRPVKVILETSKLNHEEKVIACALSKAAGAHWVKTSTGFGGGGATTDDVALMKSIVGDALEVKASGGIRSYEDAINMVSAGATRLGASASVSIVTGKKSKGSGY